MKLYSKYFDSIRVKPDPVRGIEEAAAGCQWKGCTSAGLYRAPKGRGREGQYWSFCLDHVRHYNSEYNYFEGMTNLEIEEFQKDALTGHRPTWRVGTTGAAWDPGRMRMADPHG